MSGRRSPMRAQRPYISPTASTHNSTTVTPKTGFPSNRNIPTTPTSTKYNSSDYSSGSTLTGPSTSSKTGPTSIHNSRTSTSSKYNSIDHSSGSVLTRPSTSTKTGPTSIHNSRTSTSSKYNSVDYSSGSVLTRPSTSSKTGPTSIHNSSTAPITTARKYGTRSSDRLSRPSTSTGSGSTASRAPISNRDSAYTLLPDAAKVDTSMGLSKSKPKRQKVTKQDEFKEGQQASGLSNLFRRSLPTRSKNKSQVDDRSRYSDDLARHLRQAPSSMAANPSSGDWTTEQDRSGQRSSKAFTSLPSSGNHTNRQVDTGQPDARAPSTFVRDNVLEYSPSPGVQPSQNYNDDPGMDLSLHGPDQVEVAQAVLDTYRGNSSHGKSGGPKSLQTQRNHEYGNDAGLLRRSGSGSASMGHRKPTPQTTSDRITVQPHVWRYIREHRQADLENIMKFCRLDEDRKAELNIELKAKSENALNIALDMCIQLIQEVTEQVHVDTYKVTGFTTTKAAARQLKGQFKCTVDADTSNRQDKHQTLSVISLKTDVEAIKKHLLKDSPGQPKPSTSSDTAHKPGRSSPVVTTHNRRPSPSLDLRHGTRHQAPLSSFEPTGYNIGSVLVLVHRCDITTISVDVIVNSVSPYLQLEGALAGAMSRAGGPEVQAQCTQIVRQQGQLSLSGVVATGAGRMPAKAIFHACGPVWPRNADLKGREKCIAALRETVHNVLELAVRKSMRSIAIPPLSSGVYGVPGRYVADVLAECVQGHQGSPIREVHLIDLSTEFLTLMKRRLDDLVDTGRAGTAMAKPKVQELVEATVASSRHSATSAAHPAEDDFKVTLNTRNDVRGMGDYGPQERRAMSLPYTPGRAIDSIHTGFQPKGFIIENRVKVFIHHCDITKLRVDAIVNAANVELKHGGGLSRVIATAAGRDLVDECRVITRSTVLMVSQVVRTRAGNLQCKYVYHAIGPWWPRDDNMTAVTQCLKDLDRTFQNIFEAAEKDSIESVACPAVSSGMYRVPLEHVAKCLSRALLTVTRQNPKGKLREIHLVDVTNATLQAILKAFDELESRGLVKTLPDSSVRQVSESRSGRVPSGAEGPLVLTDDQWPSSSSPGVPGTTHGDSYSPVGFTHQGKNIFVHQCDITCLKVDGIVNAANNKLNHYGGLAKSIMEAAGPALVAECRKMMDKYISLDDGDVIVTPGGRLHARHVLHSVGPRWPKSGRSDDQKHCLKLLNMTFEKMMHKCKRLDLKSVAIPAISSGIFGVPEDKVATAMCQQIVAGASKCPQLKDIHLVDFSKNMLTLIEARLRDQQLQQLDVKRVKDLIDNAVDSSKPRYIPPSMTGPRMAWRGVEEVGYHRSTSTPSHPDPMSSTAGSHRPRRSSSYTSGSDISDSGTRENGQRDVRPKERTSTVPKEVAGSETDDAKTKPASGATGDDEVCVICMCEISDPKTLDKCKHTFCRACIEHMFKSYQPKCPSCGVMYGVEKGTQPAGNMSTQFSSSHLPGHEGCGSHVITYSFSSGIQDAHHPSPGRAYSGTYRTAYLPDTKEGRTVLKLLKKAFNAKLLFTIGRSVTTGSDNVVTWNDVHHKTSMTGGPTAYGYPDPTYLNRVKEELAAKGITE